MNPLSPREAEIITLLAEGHSYSAIQERVGISQACLHLHVHNIRKKTGITNTKNPSECAEYVNRCSPSDPRNAPTPRQVDVFRLLVAGRSYHQIADSLGLSSAQTAQNHAAMGCKRAGIVGLHGIYRTRAIGQYLAKIDKDAEWKPAPNPMDDPMF